MWWNYKLFIFTYHISGSRVTSFSFFQSCYISTFDGDDDDNGGNPPVVTMMWCTSLQYDTLVTRLIFTKRTGVIWLYFEDVFLQTPWQTLLSSTAEKMTALWCLQTNNSIRNQDHCLRHRITKNFVTKGPLLDILIIFPWMLFQCGIFFKRQKTLRRRSWHCC